MLVRWRADELMNMAFLDACSLSAMFFFFSHALREKKGLWTDVFGSQEPQAGAEEWPRSHHPMEGPANEQPSENAIR